MTAIARIAVPIVLVTLLLVLSLDVGRLVLAPTREASIDAVRIRNAMVAELGSPAQTTWRPDRIPTDFQWESLPVPDYFAAIVDRLRPSGGQSEPPLATAVRLARHLRETSRRGPPIQANTRETYEKIVGGLGGYCSDYTQSFNALALAAGLDVREWGFAWENMANGHALNEVWEPLLQKWVLIDSFISFYVVDRNNGVPLSVLEFRDALLDASRANEIEVVKIVPERFGFRSVDEALAWYRRGMPRLFLVLGNNVYSYDADPVVRATEALPRSVEMTAAILLGRHPRFLFVPRPTDVEVKEQVREMGWSLAWVLGKLAAIVTLAIALLVILWRLLRARFRKAAAV
ncbi:transglutaminase domain-containing protein [Pelagibius marinus]|uniref:transglutaminase domain-containing protein n=1 Tax=Pelagibius marinus TaxID=2762760 RepID=UPI0018726D23|nr:transglutaminase domain-containing protein [Pelagibius marinus]